MDKEPRIRIEEPASGRLDAIVSAARGWIAGDAVPGPLALGVGDTAFPVARSRRRDVERAHPDKASCGFTATIDFRLRLPDDDRVVLRVDGREALVATLDVDAIRRAHLDWHAAKQRKLAWLESRLSCPRCNAALAVPGEAGDFACQGCGSRHRRTATAIDLLSPEQRAQYRLDETENVSAHPYPLDALAFFREIADAGGMSLDVGSGDQRRIDPSIICAEVVPYAAADVLAAGQRLPFRDEAFDGVYSNAVLEHVTDPFGCAREMMRVLKPGGRIFCSVPFLQPEHGYPHHYYNMTQDGLAHLFASLGATLDRQWVPDWGHPLYAGQWFMSSYLDGLPPEERRALESMTIADFLRLKRNRSEPIFAHLADAQRRILACSNAALFTKPRA